jgi:Holliday junction resolvasome, endonuclease subunit
MRFIGVDPSFTRTGLSILNSEGGVELLTSIKTSAKKSTFERQREITETILSYVRGNDVVCLEDFGVSARFAPSGRFVERIEICGMLKLTLSARTGLPWVSIAPNMLKSFIAGKGSAKKEEVMASVRNVWKVDVGNDDEADAFALAAYARTTYFEDPRYVRKTDKFLEYGDNSFAMKRIRFLSTSL